MEEHLTETNKPEMINSKSGRFFVIAGSILMAMILSGPTYITTPALAITFPAGLIYSIQVIFGKAMSSHELSRAYAFPFIAGGLGWLIYLVFSIFAILEQKRTKFFTFYAILVVLLIINFAGCQVMQHPR